MLQPSPEFFEPVRVSILPVRLGQFVTNAAPVLPRTRASIDQESLCTAGHCGPIDGQGTDLVWSPHPYRGEAPWGPHHARVGRADKDGQLNRFGPGGQEGRPGRIPSRQGNLPGNSRRANGTLPLGPAIATRVAGISASSRWLDAARRIAIRTSDFQESSGHVPFTRRIAP